MYGLKEMLLQERKHLEGIIAKVSENKNSAPEGRLRISVDHGNVRYYNCINDRYGDYIPRENELLPRQLAQKAYNDSVLKTAETRAKLIRKCLKDYDDDEVEQLFTSLHAERQKLITPVEPTFSQLEARWYSEPYTGKAFKEGTPVIISERGERVRSKSEKILADYFFRNNILYKYEKPLNLVGYGIVYPDFTFLSRKLRREIYWEHEGRMDKPEYAIKAVKKLNSYQMTGIMPGECLILTFETEQDVLNMKIVNELVDKYLR
ncbi:MAG: hypothetical protein K5770_13275 [Lachnospiraceae bacterium]|nr:hypothetical protein [Lachnospiraceae bacterium]